MKNIFLKLIFFILVLIISPYKVNANSTFDFYMNDFYSKSKEASQILKEIESSLKDGSRKNVCIRQREAANLGLLANKSLIKAFEIRVALPPKESMKESQRQWESIINDC